MMRRVQFSLKTLLWLTLVVGVCLSPIGQLAWLLLFPARLGRLNPPPNNAHLAEMMPPHNYARDEGFKYIVEAEPPGTQE